MDNIIKKQTKNDILANGIAYCANCGKIRGIDAESTCIYDKGMGQNINKKRHNWMYRKATISELKYLGYSQDN